MDELMLHVLDIAMNAVTAGARTVRISIAEETQAGRLTLCIADNGPGMSGELRERVLTELATTKQKQRGWRGFGLALFRTTIDQVEGSFRLLSRLGVGTLVQARLPREHIDLPPLGDVAGSLQALLAGCGDTDLCFTHRVDNDSFRLDTRTVRRELGELYATQAVRAALGEWLHQGEAALALRRAGS